MWRPDLAAERIAFFEEVLHLNGGDYEGKPFILLPWQAFIVGSLQGWRCADADGETRRFRVAYVETGKGSGKSPLAAGHGLAGLTADGEARAEIYAAATKKDQAMVLFRDAVAMYTQSPELLRRLTPSGVGENTWNLGYRATGSFFRSISADDGQSGPRPHIALIDEVHEHKTAAARTARAASITTTPPRSLPAPSTTTPSSVSSAAWMPTTTRCRMRRAGRGPIQACNTPTCRA